MDKRDAIPAAICLALLFGWMFYFNKPTPRPTPPADIESVAPGSTDMMAAAVPDSTRALAAVAPDSTTASTTVVNADGVGTTPTDVKPVSTAATLPSAPFDPGAELLTTAVEERAPVKFSDLSAAPPLVLHRPKLSDVTIDPEVGGVTSVTIHEYRNSDRSGPMVLGDAQLPMYAINTAAGTWAFSHANVLAADDNQVRIERRVIGTTLVIEQAWKLDNATPYSLGYTVTVHNRGDQPVTVPDFTVNVGSMHDMDTVEGFMGSAGADQRVDLRFKGDGAPKNVNLGSVVKWNSKGEYKYAGRDVDWSAVQNKYFVSIIAAKAPFTDSKLINIPLQKELGAKSKQVIGAQLSEPEFSVPARVSKEMVYDIYVGPKKFALLQSMDANEKAIMHFDLFMFFHVGAMEWISRAIFWGIVHLHGLFGNFGWAIIVVTVVIRFAFFPLTHRSTLLTKKMQALAPQVAKINEQHANDPQRKNAKVMELYKENKVNPLGGCLPMVVQIPVFFALFNVLRSAIELRQQGFLWVSDLSMPDSFHPFGVPFPVNPLAILMGGTMMVQQKLTPSSPDPNQARMMMFMSVGFMFMLYNMPSGLTLYWTTNQVCAIVQYQLTKRLLDKGSAPLVVTPAKA